MTTPSLELTGRPDVDAFIEVAILVDASDPDAATELVRRWLDSQDIDLTTTEAIATLVVDAMGVQRVATLKLWAQRQKAKKAAERAAERAEAEREHAAVKAGIAAHRAGLSRDAMTDEHKADADSWLLGWDLAAEDAAKAG